MSVINNIKAAVAVVCLVALLGVVKQAGAGPEVIASGLFKDRALLTIDGRARMLTVGETSPEGVTLKASSSQGASVVIDGELITLGLSERIASNFSRPEFSEVKIPRGKNGHYFTKGAINGVPVEFMVDTGATSVAMNRNEAARLGLDLSKARKGLSSTAGGLVDTFVLDLDSVRVGSITLHKIRASVIDGDFPTHILLGNAFLSKVKIEEQAGVLVFRKQY